MAARGPKVHPQSIGLPAEFHDFKLRHGPRYASLARDSSASTCEGEGKHSRFESPASSWSRGGTDDVEANREEAPASPTTEPDEVSMLMPVATGQAHGNLPVHEALACSHAEEAEPVLRTDSAVSQGTPSKAKGHLSTTMAVTNLVTCMIGASVLSLPRLVADSGWCLGPALVVFAGGVSCRMCVLVCRALAAATILDGAQPSNIGDAVEVLMGPRGKALALACTCFYQVCKCGVYFVVIGANLHYWTDRLTEHQCILIAVVCGVWMVFIRSLATISKGSIVGVISVALYLSSIIGAGLSARSALPDAARPSSWWPLRARDLPQTFAVMFYTYAPADVLPAMRVDMRHPEELSKAVIIAHACVAFCYVFLAGAGYHGWGLFVTDNVLQSMCDHPGCRGIIPADAVPGGKWLSGYVLSTAVVANLAVTLPIVLYCVFNVIEGQVALLQSSRTTNLAMRMGVVLGAVSVAVFVPHFLAILGVISTALLTMLQIFLPLGFTYAMSRRGIGRFGAAEWAALLLGVVVLLVGLSGAVGKLIRAVKGEA